MYIVHMVSMSNRLEIGPLTREIASDVVRTYRDETSILILINNRLECESSWGHFMYMIELDFPTIHKCLLNARHKFSIKKDD